MAILVRNDIAATEILTDRTANGLATADLEFVVAELKLPRMSMPANVVSFYMPQGCTAAALRAFELLTSALTID